MGPTTNGVLFSLPLLLCALPAQGEVDARCAAKKGSAAWLVHEMTMAATLELQGQEVKTSERAVRTMHVQIKDLDAAGNYVVETKFVRVHGRLEMAMGQGDFDFDSATEGDAAAGASPVNPQTRSLTAVVGKTFLATVSPTGEVLELGEGSAAILEASASRPGMQQMTSGGLKQLVADVIGQLPQKRTAGGAKWSRERVDFRGRVPTRMKLDLTLTVVEPEAFEIEASGTLDLATDVLKGNKELLGGDDAEAARQLDHTKASNGKVTSKQKTSRVDGFVLAASHTHTIDLETSESQMGEVTTHLRMTTSITRTTAEAAMPKPPAAPADGKK